MRLWRWVYRFRTDNNTQCRVLWFITAVLILLDIGYGGAWNLTLAMVVASLIFPFYAFRDEVSRWVESIRGISEVRGGEVRGAVPTATRSVGETGRPLTVGRFIRWEFILDAATLIFDRIFFGRR